MKKKSEERWCVTDHTCVCQHDVSVKEKERKTVCVCQCVCVWCLLNIQTTVTSDFEQQQLEKPVNYKNTFKIKSAIPVCTLTSLHWGPCCLHPYFTTPYSLSSICPHLFPTFFFFFFLLLHVVFWILLLFFITDFLHSRWFDVWLGFGLFSPFVSPLFCKILKAEHKLPWKNHWAEKKLQWTNEIMVLFNLCAAFGSQWPIVVLRQLYPIRKQIKKHFLWTFAQPDG